MSETVFILVVDVAFEHTHIVDVFSSPDAAVAYVNQELPNYKWVCGESDGRQTWHHKDHGDDHTCLLLPYSVKP